MFLEASFGANFHHQEGCSITGGEPNYCRTGLSVTSAGNRNLSGFGDIPYLFPDATVLDPNTFTYWVLNQVDTTMWDGTRIQAPPQFAWGTRVANPPHPNMGPFGEQPGRHRRHELHPRHAQPHLERQPHEGGGPAHAEDGVLLLPQPAAPRRGQRHRQHQLRQRHEQPARHVVRLLPTRRIGVFSTYSQTSRWAEGAYLAVNHEAFVQDNWRVNNRLTLDYGVRFVHMRPQYDCVRLQLELPARGVDARAGATALRRGLRRPTSIRARRRTAGRWIRSTGQMLGPNSTLAIGTLVPNTGSTDQWRVPGGSGAGRRDELHLSGARRDARASAPRGT